MGQTGHLALAFEQANKLKVIDMLNGNGSDDDGDCILYQPEFGLIREDNNQVHRVLEALAHNSPELSAVGTIVKGLDAVTEVGMGIQYFYSPETIRLMAYFYEAVSQQELDGAVERVLANFDTLDLTSTSAVIAEKFPVLREELSVVAKNGWAMIAGMF